MPCLSRCKPLLLCIVTVFVLMPGCKPKTKGETKSVAPAKVEALPKESDLASITLTEEADSRLGIELANPVAMKQLRKRTFGGEVLLPPGKVIQVPAPVGGKLIDAKGIPFPASGMKVRSGQVLLTLSPLLSPERDVPTPAEQVQMVGARATLVAAQVTAQGDMDRSNADLAAARINLDRAQKLFADRVASQRAVDDATAAYKVADANFLAAKQRKEQLTLLIQSLDRPPQETQRAESIPIHAPWDGIIRNVLVSSSQQVVGGSPLFEIIDTSSVWLRVPVFVDLLPSLAIDREARVVRLDGTPLAKPGSSTAGEMIAKPVSAPPSADASSASVDVYYEVAGLGDVLRPGQRVGVSIPVDQEIDTFTLPASTILYDYHGGTWIYTKRGDRKYQRTKVNVLWFDGENVVVDHRLGGDHQVVSSGAAELFGTEFGPGK